MRINGAEHLRSIQQAMSMVTMRNAMNQDAQTVDRLIEGLEELEAAGETTGGGQGQRPGLGTEIDIRA